MIKGCKICGVSDPGTLSFIVNHPYPPKFIGFICNYKKSSRYVDIEKLNKLVKVNKKKSIIEITKFLNDLLERMILRNIDQWIWTHNRWKD